MQPTLPRIARSFTLWRRHFGPEYTRADFLALSAHERLLILVLAAAFRGEHFQ